jgi:hypothetical protein
MEATPEKSSAGATFYVACGVFAAVALGQVAVAAWGWQARQVAREHPAPVRQLPPVQALPKPEPVVVAVSAQVPDVEPGPPVEVAPPPIRLVETKPKAIPATLDVPITNPIILESMGVGLQARAKGDMQTALQAFRSAWQGQPDHPKLIYQLARTLDLMGLEAKAQPHWNTLVTLGHAAGDYFDLAEMRIKGKGMGTKDTPETEDGEGRLKLVDLKVENPPGFYGGEKRVLSFSIKKRDPSEKIDSADIGLAIHFFDVINGRKIDRTTANKPTPALISNTEDWEQRGVERLEVMYDQPEMTPADIVRYGQRKYWGYVLEISLRDPQRPNDSDRLQDLQADPPELTNFAREMPVDPPPLINNAADASLFPK